MSMSDLTETELSWLTSDEFAVKVGALDADCVHMLVENYRHTRLNTAERQALEFVRRTLQSERDRWVRFAFENHIKVDDQGVTPVAIAAIERLLAGYKAK
jgi:sugar phosphate isomerase/epimerase